MNTGKSWTKRKFSSTVKKECVTCGDTFTAARFYTGNADQNGRADRAPELCLECLAEKSGDPFLGAAPSRPWGRTFRAALHLYELNGLRSDEQDPLFENVARALEDAG